MIYLRYVGDTHVYKVKIEMCSQNIVTIIFDGDREVNTSGFDLFNDEECTVDIGGTVYRSFVTLYRNDEEFYQLSNDGSVYEEE